MQTSQFFQKKALWSSLPVVVAIIALLGISSCRSNEVRPLATADNCMTLSRNDVVNKWLDPGWNITGNDNYIPAIIFEVVSTSPLTVVAYPVDNTCNPLDGKKLNMAIGANCDLPDAYLHSKTRYDFVPDDADSEGDLIYFNFIRLIQLQDPTDSGNLICNVQFVTNRGGTEVPLSRADTKPCPPYCPVQ